MKRASIAPPLRGSITWPWTGQTSACEQGVLEEDVGTSEWRLDSAQACCPVFTGQATFNAEVRLAGDSKVSGCPDTRKSTSGVCFMHSPHLVNAYSRTQSNIALSSGEAEYYAAVSTALEALGLVAMTEDFGYLYADASAAIGVANREGLGRIRHLDTQSLWLQHALRKRRLGLDRSHDETCGRKVAGRACTQHGLRVRVGPRRASAADRPGCRRCSGLC